MESDSEGPTFISRATAATYHPPTEEQIKLHRKILKKALEFAALVSQITPESYEQINAITKIEETTMWSCAAIAKHQ